MSRILAVLCATQETEGLKRTQHTLNKFGIDYRVYGLGMEWQGNGMKQVAAWKISNEVLGQYKFILSLDAYDMLCVAPEDEIIWKFMSFQHPMVISAEINCWPDDELRSKYPPPRTQSPYRHICGGAYMAQTEYIAKMLSVWGVNEEFRASSDQRFLTKCLLENTGCMKIDEEAVLFQNLCKVPVENFHDIGSRMINKTTFQIPCFIHGNGQTDMSWYWDKIK